MHHNNKINNKNVVNVIINNPTKPKRRLRAKNYSNSEESSSPISYQSSSEVPFTNSSNLQNELLRQTLTNSSPQIDRENSSYYNRIRSPYNDFGIAEGKPEPEVEINDNENDLYERMGGGGLISPEAVSKKQNRAEARELLKNEYRRLGGNNPLILSSTRKPTIENAIRELMKRK